jgi:hypothetical protein
LTPWTDASPRLGAAALPVADRVWVGFSSRSRFAALTCLHGGGAGDLSSNPSQLPSIQGLSDWEIEQEDIEICRRENGEYWEIGTGGFGKVWSRDSWEVHLGHAIASAWFHVR